MNHDRKLMWGGLVSLAVICCFALVVTVSERNPTAPGTSTGASWTMPGITIQPSPESERGKSLGHLPEALEVQGPSRLQIEQGEMIDALQRRER
jgi:hypothetical protein